MGNHELLNANNNSACLISNHPILKENKSKDDFIIPADVSG